ncbi:hypothetical protein C5167_027939, partial [Papaver somniferum]
NGVFDQKKNATGDLLAPYDNELINSHLRKLLARPPRTVNRPPTPMSNPNKHFEIPPGPPPPPQDDGTR